MQNPNRIFDGIISRRNPQKVSFPALQSLVSDHAYTYKGPEVTEGITKAYDNEDGYYIQDNPVTGKREMYIAGTRNMDDWFHNVYDGGLAGADEIADHANIGGVLDAAGLGVVHKALPNFIGNTRVPHPDFLKFDLKRRRQVKRFERIAHENGVEVVYGHSRGGALVSDMKGEFDKVGLDSAMVIASDTDMINYHQHGTLRHPERVFDDILSLRGSDNVVVQDSHTFHQVWN